MESKWVYKLTRKASADLDDIVRYIALELSNPKAAADFIDKLFKYVDEICVFPEIGSPAINDFIPDIDVRKGFIDNYTVYYLPNFTEKTIFILRIVYSKRSMDEILQQLDL